MRLTPLIALVPLLLSACAPLTFTLGGDPEDNAVRPKTVLPDGRLFSPRVAVVDVSGLIHNGRSPGLFSQGENPVGLLHEQLAAAGADPSVKAVILRLNTPGGTVTGSDAMYREVRRFREATGKPVVALMMDVAASGGYYVACAADEIVAYPTTVTGSIGVIVQTISFKEGLSRIGIRTDAVTSGPNKETGSPLGTLTPGQREVLQHLVDDFYQRFVEVVATNRPGIPAERFADVTDGRIVSGGDALALGLIDRTGDLYDAFDRAKALARVGHADLISYHRPMQYVGSPYGATPMRQPTAGAAGPAVTQINLAQFNLAESPFESGAGFYYLWQPDAP